MRPRRRRASTSRRSSVFTGDLAWHSVARNVVKSCLPTSRCAASCIARGVERSRHAPGAAALEREIGAAVDDAIEIVPRARRKARVEIVAPRVRPPAPRPDAAADAR